MIKNNNKLKNNKENQAHLQWLIQRTHTSHVGIVYLEQFSVDKQDLLQHEPLHNKRPRVY
jgi:hypothetical protein